MALIPLYEAKTYLRVDSSDEDALIGILLSSAEQMCKDVGRLTDDQWEALAVWQFCMRWAICMNTGTKPTITS